MAKNKTHNWAMLFLKVLVVVALVAMFFAFEFILGVSYLFYVIVIVAFLFILANRFVKMKAAKSRKK